MTRKELDRYLAETTLGMVPCQNWKVGRWNNRAGAALMKLCTHDEDRCYSTVELHTLMGRMGGPPQYCGSSRAALMLMKRLEKMVDAIVLVFSKGAGWACTLQKIEHSGMIVVAGPSSAAGPELAVALAAAELSGLKLKCEDIID